jgi:hypothetical protein
MILRFPIALDQILGVERAQVMRKQVLPSKRRTFLNILAAHVPAPLDESKNELTGSGA